MAVGLEQDWSRAVSAWTQKPIRTTSFGVVVHGFVSSVFFVVHLTET
jgi:hypothetical protein